MKLEFLGNEIVFEPTESKNNGFVTGQEKLKQGKILYVGKSTKLGYKENDLIVYEDGLMITKKNILGRDYSIISELGITCRIIEDETT